MRLGSRLRAGSGSRGSNHVLPPAAIRHRPSTACPSYEGDRSTNRQMRSEVRQPRGMRVFLRCGRRIYDRGFAGIGGRGGRCYSTPTFDRLPIGLPAGRAGSRRIVTETKIARWRAISYPGVERTAAPRAGLEPATIRLTADARALQKFAAANTMAAQDFHTRDRGSLPPPFAYRYPDRYPIAAFLCRLQIFLR